jgi:hypothetical protein
MKPKKPYSKPRLTVHGDVRQVTRSASTMPHAKDGGPNNTKT